MAPYDEFDAYEAWDGVFWLERQSSLLMKMNLYNYPMKSVRVTVFPYRVEIQELRRMQVIEVEFEWTIDVQNKLKEIKKNKLKEKEELSTTLLSIQSEYDSCVTDCKELTEREELINFIEDHATVFAAFGPKR